MIQEGFAVEASIAQIVANSRIEAFMLVNESPGVQDILCYVLWRGGERLPPRLLLLASSVVLPSTRRVHRRLRPRCS